MKILLLIIIYCIPCIIALFITIQVNYIRSLQTVEPILTYVTYVQKGKDLPEDLIKDNFVAERLMKYLKTQKKMGKLDYSKENIKEKIIIGRIFFDYIFIAVLSLLPFVILGGGLAFKKVKRGNFSELMRLAWKDLFIKFIIAFLLSFGWLYVFSPFGQGASVVYGFAAGEDIISTDTLPFYVDYKSNMKHTMAGFLGWYLHLLGYFFYRLYRGDVVSTSVYRKLFSKLMFVFGIALILSAIATNEALIVIFLIGFFPLSGISILKEFGLKSISSDVERKASLSILLGISRWQILRLEEEYIDSIPTLATADLDKLKILIPDETISAKQLELWVNIARLISILGPERYKCVSEFCQTADNFIKKSKDKEFKKELKLKCKISNPEEIAKLLSTTFT
jgi:hypothetical protein